MRIEPLEQITTVTYVDGDNVISRNYDGLLDLDGAVVRMTNNQIDENLRPGTYQFRIDKTTLLGLTEEGDCLQRYYTCERVNL